MSSVKEVLGTVANAAELLGGTLPGPAGVVARIVSIAVNAASAFAAAGQDPEIEIKRILSADPRVKAVHDEWKRAIEAKFGPPSEPPPSPKDAIPPPPDTEPGKVAPVGPDTIPDTLRPPSDPYEP